MSRSHPGHRAQRTGSLTVVDLIKREHRPVPVLASPMSSTPQNITTELASPPLLEVRGVRGRIAHTAKIAGLVLSALTLCGSIAIASVMTHTAQSQQPAVSPTVHLDGESALRPDALDAQLSNGERPDRASSPLVPSKPKAAAIANSTGVVKDQAGTQEVEPVTSTATAPNLPVDMVREFYQLVVTQPMSAVHLIDPALLTDPLGFIQSWNSTKQIEVENITEQKDGTVQAVVRLLQTDGTWMRVVELLHITPGSTPQISGVDVLSAQRG